MKKKVTIMALIMVMLISILAGCVPNTKDNKKESETMTASEMLKSVAASMMGKYGYIIKTLIVNELIHRQQKHMAIIWQCMYGHMI